MQHPHKKKRPSEEELRKELHDNGFPDFIHITTAFLSDIDREIKLLMARILVDYTHRMNRPVINKDWTIAICGVDPNMDLTNNHLGCTVDTKDRVLIQVEDPYMNMKKPEDAHLYVQLKFLEVICHEMVHACQAITTKPKGRRYVVTHDKDDPNEKYFFDRDEIEARILEAFYAQQHALPLLCEKENLVVL
jgi:hypothetical protein